MNRVNPPKQLVLPPSVASDPQLKKAFDDRDFILFQLWKRTGAGADWVDDNRTGLYEFDDLNDQDIKQELLDDVVVTGEDYTTIGDQLIICTKSVTIKLNDEPENQELPKIRSTNGKVIIDGNGRKVNGADKAIMRRDYTSWDIMYIIENDEWVIV